LSFFSRYSSAAGLSQAPSLCVGAHAQLAVRSCRALAVTHPLALPPLALVLGLVRHAAFQAFTSVGGCKSPFAAAILASARSLTAQAVFNNDRRFGFLRPFFGQLLDLRAPQLPRPLACLRQL